MSYVYGSGTLASYTTYAHGVTGNFATADVGLVGDSITTLGRPDFAAALALDGKTLACDYWSSRPTTPAVTTTLSRPVLPRILVMACGTNDIFLPTGMTAQIARFTPAVLAAKGVEHLLWVDVHCCRTKVPLQTQVYDERNTCLVNNQIHDSIDKDHIVPWNWTINYRGITWPGYYLSDGVHPKAGLGTKFWAACLQTAVRKFY
jgi:hypothetical protein